MANGYPAGSGALLAEVARLNKKVAAVAAALASAEARAEDAERGMREWRECARSAQARAEAEAEKARRAIAAARSREPLTKGAPPVQEREGQGEREQPFGGVPDAVTRVASTASAEIPRFAPSGETVVLRQGGRESPRQGLGVRLRACIAAAESQEATDGLHLAAGARGAPPAPAPLEGSASTDSRSNPMEGIWINTETAMLDSPQHRIAFHGFKAVATPRRELRGSPRGVVLAGPEVSRRRSLVEALPLGSPYRSMQAPPTPGRVLRRMSSTRNSLMSEVEEEHSTMHSVTGQLEEVWVEAVSLEEAQGIVGYHAAQWDGRGGLTRTNKSPESVACALCALDLVCHVAEGGAMIVMGPHKDLQQLVQHVRTSDDGYMTRRLRGVHISSPEFRETFRVFSAHSETDRWPEDYPDEEARNLPAEILTSNLLNFKVSNGRIIVFDGKDHHHLMKEQPLIPNWATVESRLMSSAADKDEIEDIAHLLDDLRDASGQPVTHLRKCRGHPKDGAIIMSTRGLRLMCAVKVIGLPMARLRWPGVGTRHEAALQLATYLRQCVVFLRSDSGVVHLLCKSRASDQPEVLMVGGLLPAAQGEGEGEGEGRGDAAESSKSPFMPFNDLPIGSVYDLENTTLGQGGFGSVRKAVHKETKQLRAVKTIQKSKVGHGVDKNLEVDILKALDHPNITRLVETFEDYRNVYLVQELYAGGDLFTNIVRTGHFTERQAAIAMEQVFRGVHFLHERFVCHRDLKPENFMIATAGPLDEDNTVKIIDFGLATFFHPKRALTRQVGTPHFMAPEVIEGNYWQACDLWSCGVSLYMLLSSRPPFNGRGKAMLYANICRNNPDFSHQLWATVSADAKALTRRLLERVPEHRLSASQALRQEWVERHAPQSEEVALPKTFIEDLQRLIKMNAFQQATLHVIASELKDADILKLKEVFNRLDTDKDGTLSPAELHAGLQSHANSICELVAAHAHGDEPIEYQEFITAALDKRKLMREESCWAAFQAFDRNGDGTISRNEIEEVLAHSDLKKAFEANDMDVERILREADDDGSGSIEFEEFVRMVHKACGEGGDASA